MHTLARTDLQPPTAGTAESKAAAIRSAIGRGWSEFTYPAPFFHDGNMVIVGSGPSVTSFLEEIREEKRKGRPICAIKGAHDWLRENGIEPDLFVSCEPRERPLKLPSDTCCYMLASQCPPEFFEQLKGKRVIIWHSLAFRRGFNPPPGAPVKWDDFENYEPECIELKGRKVCIGGGSTSGLRALTIVYQLCGFRNVTLYGFDSCLAPDKRVKRFTGEDIGPFNPVDVIVAGKRFYCNEALRAQALEFQDIINAMPGLNLTIKGDGLLAAILKARKAKK